MTRPTGGIWDLRSNAWDPFPWRFYPPGCHPAAQRWRDALEQSEEAAHKMHVRSLETGLEHPDERQLVKHIAEIKDYLAQFEEAESVQKCKVARALERRS